MKKTIFATALLVALTTAAFAGGKNSDRKLLSDLTNTLKTSGSSAWITKGEYRSKVFNFNGKSVTAAYSDDYDFIGFSIPVLQSELPQTVTDALSKKYGTWKIVDAVYFIDASANTNYFVQVQKGKSNLVLKITPDGHTGIYSRM
jgi:hypothetical protein